MPNSIPKVPEATQSHHFFPLTFLFLFRPIHAVTPGVNWNYLLQISQSLSAGESYLLLWRGGLGHVGAAGPEEQNTEAEVCKLQRHQTPEGWGRIHLDTRITQIRQTAVNIFIKLETVFSSEGNQADC